MDEQTCCPKCGYVRTDDDRLVMPGTCPSCGIAYNKWQSKQNAIIDNAPEDMPDPGLDEGEDEDEESEEIGWLLRVRRQVLTVPDRIDSVGLFGRLVLLLFFFVWGWSFILRGIDWRQIGGSFMHNINLPFHEFGHLLFMPFGRFMSILGGSLFQILLPLGLMLAFVIKQRDNFAASVMLWWSGQSLIDISPYIADAPYRAILLVRGLGESAHDWGNLLTMTGTLDRAQTYARLSFSLGTLLILLSFVWGAYLLYLQKKQLT